MSLEFDQQIFYTYETDNNFAVVVHMQKRCFVTHLDGNIDMTSSLLPLCTALSSSSHDGAE